MLTEANGTDVPDPVLTRYDPVARVVTISGQSPTWLKPGQPYKLRLMLPPNDDIDDRGLRAIDRSTLDPNQPLEFAFFAAEARGVKSEKTVDFCGDVLPIFSLKCTSGVCHAGDPAGGGAASGLVLDSFTGIQKTAIGRVANGSNTSGRSGDPEAPRGVFGINMAIIDPGRPDTSWLLYKLELAREPAVDSGTSINFICNKQPDKDEVALPTSDPLRYLVKVRQADEIERAILNDHVPGREMPFPFESIVASSQQPLTFDERERIRLWIAQGARITECGGCTQVGFIPEAGADVGPVPVVDAGSDADLDGGADAADAQDQ